MVKSALDGFNVCIFAYGQTGAGKTFTMEGSKLDGAGLIPRAIDMVFEYVNQYKKEEWQAVQVTLSCIEIHKETVRDLLDPSNSTLQIMTNN